MKTHEQREAQRARAKARRERRTNESVRRETKREVLSEKHVEILAKVEKSDGVLLENKDGGWEKWRLTIDGSTVIVEARIHPKRQVGSIRRG